MPRLSRKLAAAPETAISRAETRAFSTAAPAIMENPAIRSAAPPIPQRPTLKPQGACHPIACQTSDQVGDALEINGSPASNPSPVEENPRAFSR